MYIQILYSKKRRIIAESDSKISIVETPTKSKINLDLVKKLNNLADSTTIDKIAFLEQARKLLESFNQIEKKYQIRKKINTIIQDLETIQDKVENSD